MLKRIVKDEWYPFYCLSDYGDVKEIPDDLIKRYEKAVRNMQKLNDELSELYRPE